MKITGIDYIDNKLHIQVSAKNNLRIDNHGEIYLKNNATNEKKTSNYNLHFILEKNEERIDYTEYVFDIPKEELKNYLIYGDFVANEFYMNGNWRVTFQLEE